MRRADGNASTRNEIHKAAARHAGLGVVLAACLGSTAAWGQSGPSAPATSNGSYTVAIGTCGGCYTQWIEERVGSSGAWSVVGYASTSFTNKPAGTYYYRVGYYYFEPLTYTGYSSYSHTIKVSVAGGASDPLERQLAYRYEVRRGDVNADGRTDLYVNRTAGGTAGNGAIDAVILRQGSDGRFTPLAPSDAQRNAAARWPIAPATVTLNDVNADGFADVLLGKVAAAAGASAASDQVVFAPGGDAVRVRPIDSAFRRFAADVRRYLANPDYFAENAPMRVVTETVYDVWCNYGTYGHVEYGSTVLDCYWTPRQVTSVQPDYSGFDRRAVSIWDYEASIYGGAVARPTGLDAIEAVIEQLLGLPVGGGALDGISGELGRLDDRDYRRGFELFTSLFGIGVAAAQEAPRRSDTVYVTGRRIIGWLPLLHTALEYNRSTVSATDSDARVVGNGVLVSRRNWGSDAPHLMMTLGTVTRTSTAAAAHWSMIVGADSRYDDNLPYHPTPRPGQGRYNSNGFVHGLIRATGGRSSVDMNRFPGGNVPVPSSAFN